jgi:hypothetical protein
MQTPALTAAALALPLLASGCGPVRVSEPPSRCIPECHRNQSCAQLDARLEAARLPLLRCIGEEARRGHLDAAHRCYRSVRLLESARWWLSSLMGVDEVNGVYQPSETVRLEFLCHIERLSRAGSPDEIERLYLDTIRSYP